MATFTKIVAVLPSLAIVLAGVNSLAYWAKFDVNVFAHLSLSQLVLMSFTPLLWISISLFVGWMVASRMLQETRQLESAGKFRRAKLQDIVMKTGTYGFAIFGAYGVISDHPMKAYFLAPFCALIATEWASENEWVTRQIRNPKLASLILAAGILSLFSAYGRGEYDAHRLITGKYAQALSADGCAQRFVGRAGEVVFFFNPNDSSVRYTLISEQKSFVLHSVKDVICQKASQE